MTTGSSRPSRPPLDVLRRAARALARSLDVCGVYWGVRRRRGEWCDEPCLSVQVYKKHSRRRLPESRALPRRFDGLAVDVVEVGLVRAAGLSHEDRVAAAGHLPSTITCLRRVSSKECHALVSGHGTMPFVGGKIARTFPSEDVLQAPVVVNDDDGAPITGKLVVGRIDAKVDCAIASFRTTADVQHKIAGHSPLVRRVGGLAVKDPVKRHVAGTGERVGVYDGKGLIGQPVLLGDGSAGIPFHPVLRIRDASSTQPFASSGDSGSLVFDEDDQAVGIVVATSSEYTYMLPLASVIAAFDEVSSFFT